MSTWRCEVSLLVFKNIFLLVVLTHEISSTLAETCSHVISSMSVNRTSTRLVCVKQVESLILLLIYTFENHVA